MKNKITRREMLGATSAIALGSLTYAPLKSFSFSSKEQYKLALLGGVPARKTAWPEWPVWDPAAEPEVLSMLRSGKWWRGAGGYVAQFEEKYAELIGAKRCIGTASGSAALITALHVSGVDAGDEVLVSPYTFIASYNVIFDRKALPVFVDSDPETFLLDPSKIEEKITDRTTAILPVHIYGLPADMDAINAVARKHNLKLIEDACQAWLAEYKGKKAGTLGDLGCFSFQNSKHIPTGEGGAITGNDDRVMDLCHSYHNCGRPYGSVKDEGGIPIQGSNRRMQQFQAVMLLSQISRATKDADKRLKNAQFLDKKLKSIPGIIPYKPVAGATRAAFHMYPFRYRKEYFNNAPREKFIRAMQAEGIPCSEGYGKQNHYGLIEEALNSRGYKRLFSKERLDRYREENRLPGNDQLCEEAVVLYQSLLLADEKDMQDIVNAVNKIYENRDVL